MSAPLLIGLVGCGAKKIDHPAQAADLYVGPLFKARRRFAEARCVAWYILSAKHRVVCPDQLLAPYDQSLVGASRDDRAAWGSRVAAHLNTLAAGNPGCEFVLLAGEEYGCFEPTFQGKLHRPLRGLPMGKQLAWLNSDAARTWRPAPPVTLGGTP